jgi:tetratricopeptide (TPR) repeat protein
MNRSTSGHGRFWRRWRATPEARVQVAPIDQGIEAFQEGRHGDAERLLVGAVRRAERGAPESAELSDALATLADLYRAQARYEEAEPLYRRAIAIAEVGRGREHPRVAHVLNNLALVYRAQGFYAQAEPLCRRALAIAERAHGSEHPITAAAIGNLLTVYLAQHRYAEAGPLFRRSVEIKEHLLGAEHPALAGSLSNYAAFLRQTRNDAEAAACEARARAIRDAQGVSSDKQLR